MTILQMLLNSIEKVKEENLTILQNGGVGANGFIVVNENNAYNVNLDENGDIVSCTCPHYHHRKAICKHILKVSMEKNLNIKALRTE